MDNSATAHAPNAIPSHCHHFIFSWKAKSEKSIVIINPPTDNTGYTRLGDNGETAKSKTQKLLRTLLAPERMGKCTDVFKILFTSPFSLRKKRIAQNASANNVAKHIICAPCLPSNAICWSF